MKYQLLALKHYVAERKYLLTILVASLATTGLVLKNKQEIDQFLRDNDLYDKYYLPIKEELPSE